MVLRNPYLPDPHRPSEYTARVHRALGEKPCEPCRIAENAAKVRRARRRGVPPRIGNNRHQPKCGTCHQFISRTKPHSCQLERLRHAC